MGWYADTVVPRVIDRALNTPEVGQIRARVCSGLSGEVLELGFGSGLNVQHYPRDVTAVTGVEPSDLAWRLAGPRLASAVVPVRRGGLDGQRLAFGDDSFDSAVSTFTLCTIPDAVLALQEVRRVLRPGGTVRFVEHGEAPDAGVRRWQARLDPLNTRLLAGCHMGRPIPSLLEAAGFAVQSLQTYYLPKSPRVSSAIYEGIAA